MSFTSIPIIALLCYLIGEFYKFIFKGKKDLYKLIPVIVSCFGGLLGILIFLTNPEIMCNATNIWMAMGLGIVSGVSSTGTNQIVKQIFKNN